jgi:acetyl-CoA synthetase
MSREPYELERFMKLHGFASYEALIERADRDPEWFWPAVMQYHDLKFFRAFDRVLDISKGSAWPQWCIGGGNPAYNCMERTIARWGADKIAIEWEARTASSAPGAMSSVAGGTRRRAEAAGLGKGDVVGIYMPFLPETIARSRSPGSAVSRCRCSGWARGDRPAGRCPGQVMITVDITYRRGNVIRWRTSSTRRSRRFPRCSTWWWSPATPANRPASGSGGTTSSPSRRPVRPNRSRPMRRA